MTHVVLLGDSIFDNAVYVPGGTPVIDHLKSELPAGWEATLRAVDGDVITDVHNQTDLLPDTVTHFVISVGGNDALQELGVISEPVNTVAEALFRFSEIRTVFIKNYRAMLRHVMSFGLPVAVCTIYNNVPGLGDIEKTALALYNEAILSEASIHGLPIVDLRIICNDAQDYSEISPIEPSDAGGKEIAVAISALLKTHDFGSRNGVLFSGL